MKPAICIIVGLQIIESARTAERNRYGADHVWFNNELNALMAGDTSVRLSKMEMDYLDELGWSIDHRSQSWMYLFN